MQLVRNTWNVKLTEKEQSNNLYRVPVSNLRGKSDKKPEWSNFGLRCAERYSRCLGFGHTLSACAFVFAKIVLDSAMYGLQQGMLQGVGIPLALFLLVSLVLSFPINSYFKKFLKRKRTVETFLKDCQKEVRKPFVLPFLTSIWLMSMCLLMFLSEDSSGLELTLIAYLIALPIAYTITRAASQKAAAWLDQLSKHVSESDGRSMQERSHPQQMA